MTLLLSMLLGGVTITSYAAGVNKLYYYPVIRVVESSPKWFELAGYVSFIALLAMPLAIDLIGELRWKKSRSTI